jgi:hypothetical protein
MDFLDPNKKRSHRLKLYIGYGLMAVLIGVAATVILFAASGYGIDKSGNVIQNGLVFFNSRPGNATVNVEGTFNKFKQSGQTDTRMVLREGQYTATITKDGYRSWQRQFNVEGGAVERLVYPFLFPQKLETTVRKTYGSQTGVVTQSPSRQWIMVQRSDNFFTFDVFDANNNERQPVSVTIPDSIFSKASASRELKIVEWSTDNDHILVKHTYDGQEEFIVINRDRPAESFNVNTVTAQKPFAVTLKDKKVDRLYLHMSPDGLLQEFDVRSRALTPLVGHALAFKPHGDDMLVYIAPIKESPDKVSVRIVTKEKDYELRQLPAGTSYVVDVARFDNSWYIAAGAAADNKVYVYKDPLEVLASENPKLSFFARTLRIENPQKVSFSANARMIGVQSGQKFAVYDAETDRQYRYELTEPIDTNRPAEWMDGHRFVTSSNKTVIVFDFDGINIQKLMSINPQTDVMFDRDYEQAYSLTTNNATKELTRTNLLVEN